jgi:hypothetical protein
VLKAPDYPPELSDSLTRLEKDGLLRPCASGEVESFSGDRISGIRVREPITLFCVQPGAQPIQHRGPSKYPQAVQSTKVFS